MSYVLLWLLVKITWRTVYCEKQTEGSGGKVGGGEPGGGY